MIYLTDLVDVAWIFQVVILKNLQSRYGQSVGASSLSKASTNALWNSVNITQPIKSKSPYVIFWKQFFIRAIRMTLQLKLKILTFCSNYHIKLPSGHFYGLRHQRPLRGHGYMVIPFRWKDEKLPPSLLDRSPLIGVSPCQEHASLWPSHQVPAYRLFY